MRCSLRKFERENDAVLILNLIKKAGEHPIERPVHPRKLARKPLFKTVEKKGGKTIQTVVSVPDTEEEEHPLISEDVDSPEKTGSLHTEIQYQLLKLGAEMGLDVWVARNDRGRVWNGQVLGDMSRVADELPTQFNEATNRTIEMIDVLWLKGNSIVLAFEVESTTSIYSGLLRMSDLLALQPNLEISLFLIAPEERRAKVEQEILRPTFQLRNKPLSKICGFIGFSDLRTRLEEIHRLQLAPSLKPEFLKNMATYFGGDKEI